MRPVVAEILAELLQRHRAPGVGGRVHLNDIAEVIGVRAVTPEEIEAIVDALEAEGLAVGEPLDGHDVRLMQVVLGSARRLRERLGRRPTVSEIAADAGCPEHVVRRALEQGASAAVVRRQPD